MTSIPKRIFQTWKRKTLDNDPPLLKHWQDSWKKHNPTYEYELWDDEDNRNFIKDNYSDFLEIFDSYSRNIERADVIRYFYLYHYGGIYADLDFECLKSFDIFTKDQDEVDVILGSVHFDNPENFFHSVPNAIMLAKPKSDFFLFVINTLRNIKNLNIADVEISTGPIFLKLCLMKYMNLVDDNLQLAINEKYGKDIFDFSLEISLENDKEISKENDKEKSKIMIVPENVFYPLSWEKKDKDKVEDILNNPSEKFQNSYAITYWMQSWGKNHEILQQSRS